MESRLLHCPLTTYHLSLRGPLFGPKQSPIWQVGIASVVLLLRNDDFATAVVMEYLPLVCTRIARSGTIYVGLPQSNIIRQSTAENTCARKEAWDPQNQSVRMAMRVCGPSYTHP